MTPGASAEPPRLPRAQAGAQPQHLIVTLLGDYWFGRTEPLPSASLVSLMSEFDISPSSARTALSRLARRGLLTVSKLGRSTFYSPTPYAERVLREGRERLFSFGDDSPDSWDGSWLVVVFSVPEEQRDMRHMLRTRLRWLGFGPLYDGVWVSPHADAEAVAAVLAECGVEQATVLRTVAVELAGAPTRDPLAAWNLDELRVAYEQFTERFEPLLERVRTGRVSVSEALTERTAIMDTWRTFPDLDPGLPASMLPADWPRRRAREIFVKAYDTLGPLAEFRFRQVIAEHAPQLAHLARHFTTDAAVRVPEGLSA